MPTEINYVQTKTPVCPTSSSSSRTIASSFIWYHVFLPRSKSPVRITSQDKSSYHRHPSPRLIRPYHIIPTSLGTHNYVGPRSPRSLCQHCTPLPSSQRARTILMQEGLLLTVETAIQAFNK